MIERGAYYPEGIVDISLIEIIRSFAVTYGVGLAVLGIILMRRLRQRGTARPWVPAPTSCLWILPLQAWTLQASWHAILFFDELMAFHGPHPLEGLIVLAESVAGLVLLLFFQTIAVAVLDRNAISLGLSRRGYFSFICGFAAVMLDSFFLQAIVRYQEILYHGGP